MEYIGEMKLILPKEQDDLIKEHIYLDLEIHVLSKKKSNNVWRREIKKKY